MMGIEVLEHTERQLTVEEARQLYASMADQVVRPLSVFAFVFAAVFGE